MLDIWTMEIWNVRFHEGYRVREAEVSRVNRRSIVWLLLTHSVNADKLLDIEYSFLFIYIYIYKYVYQYTVD